MRLKALDAVGTTTNPQPFIGSVQGRFSPPFNLSCEVRFPSVKRYFKICFPWVAENPQRILGKSFKELKLTYGLHTLQDLKKLYPNVESIFTLKEQEELVGAIQDHVCHIDDVSRRALTGPKEANFEFLPDEVILQIILFVPTPWLFYLVNRRLARIAKDPLTAGPLLTELSNRWGITKEALFRVLKVHVPSKPAQDYLGYFHTKQRALAKDLGLFTRGVNWFNLQELIEETLNDQTKEDDLITIIQQNDPITILSALNSSLDACENFDKIGDALIRYNHPYLSQIGVEKLTNEVEKRVAETQERPCKRMRMSPIANEGKSISPTILKEWGRNIESLFDEREAAFNRLMSLGSIDYADIAKMEWKNNNFSPEEDYIELALRKANLIDLQVPNGKEEKRKAISHIIKILRKMGKLDRAKELQTEMDQELRKPGQ